MSDLPAPTWCAPWCTRPHGPQSSAAELCESELVTVGLVRFEESDCEGWIEVSAENLPNFTDATSTRSVCLSGVEAITMSPERATALGVALIHAAGMHTTRAARRNGPAR